MTKCSQCGNESMQPVYDTVDIGVGNQQHLLGYACSECGNEVGACSECGQVEGHAEWCGDDDYLKDTT